MIFHYTADYNKRNVWGSFKNPARFLSFKTYYQIIVKGICYENFCLSHHCFNIRFRRLWSRNRDVFFAKEWQVVTHLNCIPLGRVLVTMIRVFFKELFSFRISYYLSAAGDWMWFLWLESRLNMFFSEDKKTLLNVNIGRDRCFFSVYISKLPQRYRLFCLISFYIVTLIWKILIRAKC